MEVFIVYSAQLSKYNIIRYHFDIEINHVSKTFEGAKEWIFKNIPAHSDKLEPYNYQISDHICLFETPIYEIRNESWVYFIIKKLLN